MDAADERVDQPVDDPLPQLACHERPDGAVADRPPGVGPWQERVAGEAELAPEPEDTGAGGGPEAGRDAERETLGQRPQAAAGPHRRAPLRDRHERVGDPELAAEVHRLGPPAEEPVGTHVDGAPSEVVAAQRAAEARRRLQHDHVGRVRSAVWRHPSAPRRPPAR